MSSLNFTLYDNSPCIGSGLEGANVGAYGIGCDAYSIWVSLEGNDFTGDGSQYNPLRYIGTAVSNATDGAKIKILPGIYSENVSILNKDLSFIGVGDSGSIIIDGQGQNIGNAITASSSKIHLQNLTIQNSDYGLKVESSDSNSIKNVVFTNNNYSFYINENSGYTIIDSSSFIGNNYGPYFVDSDSVMVNNSIINDNLGQGIYSSETIVNIINTTIHGNNKGIQFQSSTNDSLTLENVVLDSNSYHGVLVNTTNNENIKVKIYESRFINNYYYGSSRGSAIYSQKNQLYVENSQFINNVSFQEGNIHIEGQNAEVAFKGCLFKNNANENGSYPSALSSASNLSITDCVFLNNEHYAVGGNQSNHNAISEITVLNSIFWSNAVFFSQNNYPNINISVSYSCIEGGFAGTGNISEDPNFCNPFESILTLPSSSPCVGTGWFNENMGGLDVGCDESITKYYVSAEGLSTGNATIENPYNDITQSISLVAPGDTLVLLPGTFIENLFLGKNIFVTSKIIENGDSSYIDSTIIEGIFGLNSGHLNGFTITGNYSDRGLGISSGENIVVNNLKILNVGGVSVQSSTAQIKNTIIKQNSYSNGGGVQVADSDIHFFNVLIDSNISNSHGGGIYLDNSQATFDNVIISNNSANNEGGGLYNTSSSKSAINK